MEVGRPLEVPMPKFYTAEGRKALVLRKGFSSPTRDDVSTALGAWAIKTSKPFKLDNSKMKRSRTKQRDIWATCYDKNCEFCIHFQLGEGRDDSMLVDGSSPSPSCASWRGLGSIGLASGVVLVGLASGVPDRDERNGLAGLRDMARIVRYVTGTLESRFTGRILLLVQC